MLFKIFDGRIHARLVRRTRPLHALRHILRINPLLVRRDDNQIFRPAGCIKISSLVYALGHGFQFVFVKPHLAVIIHHRITVVDLDRIIKHPAFVPVKILSGVNFQLLLQFDIFGHQLFAAGKRIIVISLIIPAEILIQTSRLFMQRPIVQQLGIAEKIFAANGQNTIRQKINPGSSLYNTYSFFMP